ncbi:dienelactone hydrolase family protein [Acetobacterium bakii]|uniref:dienelactone hydrolase family protein n=1 Tax=Acetobacterium bakii TaxID=52689 RepID=UPI000E0E8E58|nr:dienelactone hydrolase family protein [Acetobacterium bakii]
MNQKENIKKFVYIPDGLEKMIGSLEIPEGATGLVVFAHGSGSSRHSPRNNYVADVLRSYGLGTLLLDLLTVEEDKDYDMRFDIDLLAQRMLATTKWLKEQEETKRLAIGYFGASTGAAAALQTATALGDMIGAIVSRGGRPDMAWPYLEKVKAPTLLIVGGNDGVVIELNQKAYDKIRAVKQIEIIPGATHLFQEPGTLEIVAEMAAHWFVKYLIIK